MRDVDCKELTYREVLSNNLSGLTKASAMNMTSTEKWSLGTVGDRSGGNSRHSVDKPPLRHQVSCVVDGRAHTGIYWVAGKILTVATGRGGKSTQVRGKPAEILAQQLLQQLAQEGKAGAPRYDLA